MAFNLESSVGRGEGCVCGGAGQGTTMRNSYSIAKSCNAALRRRKRALHPVAWSTRKVNTAIETNRFHINRML